MSLIGASGMLPVFASEEYPRGAKALVASVSTAWRAPATFVVRRDRLRKRDLDLLALGSQIAVAMIYASHKDEILYYGSRSRFSLRHPSQVNSHGKHLNTKFRSNGLAPEMAIETSSRRLGTYNSFFVYEKYAFGGQFYDSRRWHALEAHWRYLRRLDVSNCFRSIYTHSFAWSTGSDAHSKAHLDGGGESLDRLDVGRAFDRVMQCANWGETHGICIGPEASRIFAEIIFQKIDLEIQERIRAVGLTAQDYEILRYVDDFFIYTMDEKHQSQVSTVIETVLSEYGFSINPMKTRDYLTPFTTSISSRKATLKLFLKQALPTKGKLPDFDSREVSVHLKALLIDADNDAAAVGTSLAQVERRLKKFLKKRASRCASPKEAQEISSYAWMFIHSMLYQYLSHPSVTSAMKIVRTLRFYWTSPSLYSKLSNEGRSVERYRADEALHFALSRTISRLSGVAGSEVEISHFLSLASACGAMLSSSNALAEEVLAKICQGLGEMKRSPKSNQSSLFLLLAAMKYFLDGNRVDASIRTKFCDLANLFADHLLSDQFVPGGRIRRHASQELFVLAVLECPFLSSNEKFQMLNRPWTIRILSESVEFDGDSSKGANRFLRKCVADAGQGVPALGFFTWHNEHFDELLYEKEPQFIY